MSRFTRRTTLVLVSIAGHLAIGVGLFASGVWKLERLESDHRLAAIGVMTPSQAMGGSPAALPEPRFEKKQQVEKKIVKDVQWDRRVEKTDERPQVAAQEPGGSGNGEGTGTGDHVGADDGGGGGGLCTDLTGCVSAPADAPPPPKLPAPPKVQVVSPTVMNALRIAGNTQIHPTRVIKNEILHDGKMRVVGTVKLCISATGAISSATMLSSTKYPAYDELLLAGVRSWRYKPYTVNGVPQPACSPVSFVYVIK